MLHKILHISLKDCWGAHKGCLGPECGPQNRSWESLVYMNWIESHSRIDEGVTVGSCSKNRLLFADDLVLLACSQQFSACTLSVFCCMQSSRNENQHHKYRGTTFLYKPKAVYAASERQYTAGHGEVEVPRGVFMSDGRRSARRLIRGLVKLTQFCVSFIAQWTKRSFQTPQSCQFLYRSLFWSLPLAMVMNLGLWPKEY